MLLTAGRPDYITIQYLPLRQSFLEIISMRLEVFDSILACVDEVIEQINIAKEIGAMIGSLISNPDC